MTKKLLLVLWAFLVFSPYAMADCKSPSASAIPPFLGSAVSIPPNVLIVMDVSGSMRWKAYEGDYTGTEEGYFDPNAVYSYDKNGGYWYQSNRSASDCPPPPSSSWYFYFWYPNLDLDKDKSYTGSCLNFHHMSRIDLLRWVLTGGSPRSCSNNNQNCDRRLNTSDKLNNGSDIILTTYSDENSGENVLVPISRIDDSLLLSLAN
ncbi:MAG TPA: hypothetical protein ENM99_01390, partial [Desulfurella acetivorans]|nr:hypothetical protein [Desulfurella acetivorans]